MSKLSILIELQSIHDCLNIIQRDLSNFPPDLAKLDTNIKAIDKKNNEVSIELTNKRNDIYRLNKDLLEAKSNEDSANQDLKKTVQKIQYSSAIRKLDECQRRRITIERLLKEIGTCVANLEQMHANFTKQRIELTQEFNELKNIFLAEHINQIEAKTRLQAKRKSLENSISTVLLAKFNRLIQQRFGQAVTNVDNGICNGCQTRLRAPLIANLRESNVVFCESCQRIIYLKQ